MTDNIKLCPDCNAEYFAHVEECAECEVALVHPPAHGEAPADAPEHTGNEGQKMIIEQGGLGIISELAGVLKGAGVPFEAGLINDHEHDDGCSDGSCGPQEVYGIAVPSGTEAAARKTLDDYWESLDPAMKLASERALNGQCPACGYQAGSMSGECPECGLNLSGEASPGGGGCRG